MNENVPNENNGISLSQEQGEKLLSQSRVNDIVAHRLAQQEEKLQRRFEEELNRVKSTLPNEDAVVSRVQNELEIKYKKALEEQQNAAIQTQCQRDLNQYETHVKDIKLEPEEDKLGLFDPKNEQKYFFLRVAAGNMNMEDTGEIMKELARNPKKLRDLTSAAKEHDWDYVKVAFKDIANSMKENKNSLKTYSKSSEPLSHLKPSSGGSSNREMTLDDYRNDPSLRF